jgi:uncharacterized protein YcbX
MRDGSIAAPILAALFLLAALLRSLYLFIRGPLTKRVSELWVYPIKSCAGVKVEAAVLHRGGLQWDREFAVVNDNGEVLSQKTYPKLANICPTLQCAELQAGSVSLPAKPGPKATLTGITLHNGPPSSTSSPSVHVDLGAGAKTMDVRTTWVGNSAPLEAVRYPEADAWLTAYMGFPCGLCRLKSRRTLRTTRLAPVATDADSDRCMYHDGAPLTLLTEQSVRNVRARAPKHQLSACRFRPNILISGCETALEETKWSRVAIGGGEGGESGSKGGGDDGGGDGQAGGQSGAPAPAAGIRVLMDAYRCTMVTIAQAAEMQPGVVAGSRPQGLELMSVMKKRYGCKPATHGPLPKDNPNFAMFAAPEQDEAVVRVGDEVSVVATIGEAPSSWAYNEQRSSEAFTFDETVRFWTSSVGARHREGGPRVSAAKKGA